MFIQKKNPFFTSSLKFFIPNDIYLHRVLHYLFISNMNRINLMGSRSYQHSMIENCQKKKVELEKDWCVYINNDKKIF